MLSEELLSKVESLLLLFSGKGEAQTRRAFSCRDRPQSQLSSTNTSCEIRKTLATRTDCIPNQDEVSKRSGLLTACLLVVKPKPAQSLRNLRPRKIGIFRGKRMKQIKK